MSAVLLAIDEVGPAMRVALSRARALSRAAGGLLNVQRVVPPASQLAPLVDLFEAERELRRELQAPCSDGRGVDRLRLSGGDFSREVSASVSKDRAQLVVLADAPAAARRAAGIARSTRVPVLVARTGRPHGPVLGTTALEHRRYPVIKRARQVAAWLEARVVVLHNLPVLLGDDTGTGLERAMADDRYAMASCCQHLAQVTREHAPGADIVVGRHDDTLAAILETERVYGCDVLVVGARVGAGASPEPSLAESVVREAHSSVLVTPME
jgi:nucleotide-binding universal stress UspA family protein